MVEINLQIVPWKRTVQKPFAPDVALRKRFAWGVSALFLAPGFPRFPSASCMTASSVTSVFEESCFGFDRLRRAVALVLGDRSLLE